MKILLFIDSLGAGGAQRQFVGLANMLQEHGHSISIILYHNDMFYEKDLNSKISVEVIQKCTKMKRLIKYYKIVKRLNPECVIAYLETPSLIACAIKALSSNYRLIVSERNTTQYVGMKERIRFFLYRWADTIVPNSYAQEEYLSNHYPWMKSKLKTITNFVDLQHFDYINRSRNKIPEIAIVASIWESKNTLGFIEAVKLLADDGLNFHISWYGKTTTNLEYFNKSQGLIDKYKINRFIQLLDKTSNIKEVYQNADFFCLPSFYEGTPNVICEAMATGLPIICSNICNNQFYVNENKNGFLFNPNCIKSIASSIKRALETDILTYNILCLNSRIAAEEKLDPKEFVNKYLSIIDNKYEYKE